MGVGVATINGCGQDGFEMCKPNFDIDDLWRIFLKNAFHPHLETRLKRTNYDDVKFRATTLSYNRITRPKGRRKSFNATPKLFQAMMYIWRLKLFSTDCVDYTVSILRAITDCEQLINPCANHVLFWTETAVTHRSLFDIAG